jgi:hypothetical protein
MNLLGKGRVEDGLSGRSHSSARLGKQTFTVLDGVGIVPAQHLVGVVVAEV